MSKERREGRGIGSGKKCGIGKGVGCDPDNGRDRRQALAFEPPWKGKPTVIPCEQLRVGESARVACFCTREHPLLVKLFAPRITPGVSSKLMQKWPAYAIQCEDIINLLHMWLFVSIGCKEQGNFDRRTIIGSHLPTHLQMRFLAALFPRPTIHHEGA